MALLQRFDPPGHLPDLSRVPGLLDQWHEAVSLCFDGAVDSEKGSVTPGPVQYYNPARYDPGGPLVEQAITWNAFPKELLRQYGRARALVEADSLWQLSRYSGSFAGPGPDQLYYRPHNEYCEWRVVRDPDIGKIMRVTFTSEPPEYWQALFGDNVDIGNGQTYQFHGNQELVVELYRKMVGRDVQLDDLAFQKDVVLSNGSVLFRKGQYNPYNKWNTKYGIVHLCAPPNSLAAEIQLGADATVLRQDSRGESVVEPDALVCGAGYGGPDRNSDPTIGASVNALARTGAFVTLANPVGLYMDHIDLAGWESPDGGDISDCVFIERGSLGMIERMTVEVAAERGYTVGDLKIAGEPIRFGGQIAECITVKLVGIAARLGANANQPAPCVSRCAIDPFRPTMLDSPIFNDEPLPPGTVAAFVNEGELTPPTAAAIAKRKIQSPRSVRWK